MNKNLILIIVIIGWISGCGLKESNNKNEKLPNVVLIYTDDLGYGDISAYGGEIPTPNIDGLAKSGIQFSNAYATAATCTPSRFSLLTGEYAWRTTGTGVADGDAGMLIQLGRETWPSVMQRAGYTTAAIGKWHLGLGDKNGPDWNGAITPGPLEIGFDYAFLVPATNDRVPTVFTENHHVVNLDPDDPIEVNYHTKVGDRPTGLEHPELLKMMWSHGHNHTIINGVSRMGYMKGGESALWRDEDISDILVDKAIQFIDEQKDKPFFIYLSTVDIHVPRIVHERFQGATEFGPRGDMIVQLDSSVGDIIKALEDRGLRDNTILIFTSDNGPVLDDGYADKAEELTGDHKPWGNFRGGKYSAFEAGTRIPFIISWPEHTPEGVVSDALFSQVDMLASFADFTGQAFNKEDASDSRNHWKVLIGQSVDGRQGLVQEAIRRALGYVSSNGYKYIAPHKGSRLVPWGTGIETGFDEKGQLYNLREDPSESHNLFGLPQYETIQTELEQALISETENKKQ